MLSAIRLKDFKSFSDESVELSPLTLLVGANASGKSNLLDAVRFLQGIGRDLPIADILRGRTEGGLVVWPGIRGGLKEIARAGTISWTLQTRWSLYGAKLQHSITDCDRFGNEKKAAARMAEHAEKLIACLAVEEVEVWMLALYRNELGCSWQDVRAHCDPKERYADPFLEKKGWIDKVGKGRKHAMRALGARWKGLLSICPEIQELKRLISVWIELAR